MHCDRETYLVNSTLVGHTDRAGTDVRTEENCGDFLPFSRQLARHQGRQGEGGRAKLYSTFCSRRFVSPTGLPSTKWERAGNASNHERGGTMERAASIQPPSIDLDLAGSTMRKTMRTPTRRGAKGSSTPQDCRSGWARGRIAKPRSAYGKAPHSAPDTLFALSPPSAGQDKGRKERG